MKKLTLLGLMMISGCGGLKTQISFSNRDTEKLITGTIKGSLSKVQEFRSLLESLEYRETEKAK